MTTTVPANERGPASATDANPTRVETHPAVLPPDVEGLKPVTSTGDDDANQEDSTEREQLKSKGSDHELCHHVHHSDRAPWLRAMILGASDGLVSVASLMLGVAAGSSEQSVMLLSGVAGLVGGALSMAVGEYISVSSQRDAEQADIEKERIEQAKGPEAQARELDELTEIYQSRGLSYELARRVAEELTSKDVIRAHARDELGIDLDELANPLQAAFASMLAFAVGAGMPLLAGAFISSRLWRIIAVALVSSFGLLFFGILGAVLGGAWWLRGAARVLIGGWIAMGITFGFGFLFDHGGTCA